MFCSMGRRDETSPDESSQITHFGLNRVDGAMRELGRIYKVSVLFQHAGVIGVKNPFTWGHAHRYPIPTAKQLLGISPSPQATRTCTVHTPYYHCLSIAAWSLLFYAILVSFPNPLSRVRLSRGASRYARKRGHYHHPRMQVLLPLPRRFVSAANLYRSASLRSTHGDGKDKTNKQINLVIARCRLGEWSDILFLFSLLFAALRHLCIKHFFCVCALRF